MDGWVFFLSLSPHDPWSVHACPMQVHVHAVPVSIPPVTCRPVSAHYFFTLIVSVLSQLIFRPAYSFSASPPPPPPCPHYCLLVICFFNFSTHSLHSSFSLPFLLLLQSNLSDLSLFPPITKSVLLALRLLVPIYISSATPPDLFLGFFGFEVGNCCSMLLDPYNGDGAKYRRWVISLLALISRPGSDMASISCEAVDDT